MILERMKMNKVYFFVEEYDPDLGFWETTSEYFDHKDDAFREKNMMTQSWGHLYQYRIVKQTTEIL